jgi:hypothetical protein
MSDRRNIKDDRGAVLVLALLMCTLLVGILWFVIGIGDVVVARERAQGASDAAAFSAAVIHARGMNFLVLVNLVMAAILAVRVMLKLLQVVLIGATVAFAALALVPGFQEFAAAAGEAGTAAEQVSVLVDRTRQPINEALQTLNTTEHAIAATTGGVATAVVAVDVVPKYRPLVTAGVATPGNPLAKPASLLGALPVEDSDGDKLCKEAGDAFGGLIQAFFDQLGLNALGAVSDKLLGFMGPIAASAPSFFCELGTGDRSVPGSALDGIKNRAQESCQGAEDSDKCLSDFNDALDGGSPADPIPSAPGASGNEKSRVSLRVKGDFVNGGPSAQLFSVLTLDSARVGRSGAGGLRVATFGRDSVNELDLGLAFAQAEFFYDCDDVWTAASCNAGEEALWNFRWRARLRRANLGAAGTALTAPLVADWQQGIAQHVGSGGIEGAASGVEAERRLGGITNAVVH